jgi:hypothetical protein
MELSEGERLVAMARLAEGDDAAGAPSGDGAAGSGNGASPAPSD